MKRTNYRNTFSFRLFKDSMTLLSLFYIAAAFAQETTTQANNETTTAEPEKNNCKYLTIKSVKIVLIMV